MIRNEERTGLVLTVAGGAGLLLVMLWLLGFFHEPELPKKNTVHATPRRSGGLAGEVADARTGRPVEGTTIELSGLDAVSDHWLAPADTERPLRFELKSVPAERDFTLEVGAPGYVTARRATRIAAGTTTEVGRIDLVPLAAISGTAVDANFEALGGAEVVAERVDPDAAPGGEAAAPELPRRATSRADAHGAFRLDGLAPGRWQVHATAAEGERTLGAMLVDATHGGATDPIELDLFPAAAPNAGTSDGPGGDVKCDPAPPADARELVVRVVDASGQPLAGAQVELVLDEKAPRLRLTARNGRTTFRGIPERAAFAWSVEARTGTSLSFNAAPVPTARTGSAFPFELRCVPTHALAVKVFDPDGKAVAGARVSVLVPTKRAPQAGVAASDAPTAQTTAIDATTGADGSARFTRLPPPPWIVSVDDGRFEPFAAPDAKPEADGTYTVKLAKKRGG
jgi:hypothetical protein